MSGDPRRGPVGLGLGPAQKEVDGEQRQPGRRNQGQAEQDGADLPQVPHQAVERAAVQAVSPVDRVCRRGQADRHSPLRIPLRRRRVLLRDRQRLRQHAALICGDDGGDGRVRRRHKASAVEKDVQWEVAVAGEEPVVLLRAVIAVAIDIQRLSVLFNGHLLPVEEEPEVEALGQRAAGGEKIGIGGKGFSIPGDGIEEALVAGPVPILP